MERTWITKDGTVRTKTYKTINGIDAKMYKKHRDKEYYEKHRSFERERQGKIDRLTSEDVDRMKELRSLGLSITKIGRLYNLSRYLAQMAIIAHP